TGSTPDTSYPYFSGRHNITTGTNLDPYGLFPQVASGGGTVSAMVGNDLVGSEGEKIRYYVHVPVGFNNYSLGFKYACVLENAVSHSYGTQAAFFVRGFDSATGAGIQCATLTYVADSSLPGFTLSSTSGAVGQDVLYLPWTNGTLNLSGQGGKTIILEVESHDCTLGGHFGYGYFDIVSCGQFTAVIANCDLDAGDIELQAPRGYKSYSWFKGPTISGAAVKVGQTIHVTPPPTPTFYYCVVVPYNSNGCTDTIRTINFADFKINATPDTACISLGKPIHLDVTVISGGLPNATYYYAWFNSSALSSTNIKNPIFRPYSTQSVYTVVTDSATGCKRRDTVFVQYPPFKVALGPDITTCLGTPIILYPSLTPPASGYVFKWTGTDMTRLSDSVVLNPKYTPTVAGDNTYKIRVDSGGCAVIDSFTIHTLPNTVNVRDTALCQYAIMDSTNVLVNGNNAFYYTWSPTLGLNNPHTQTPTISADTTRTYTITASYPNCPDIANHVTIKVEPNPLVNIDPNSISTCAYAPVFLQAHVTPTWYSDYSFAWQADAALDSFNTEQVTFSGTQTTMLHVLVTTPIGCVGSDSVFIEVYDGDFGTVSPSDSIICTHTPVHLEASGGISYRWTPSLYLSDSTGPDVTANLVASMAYTLYVTDKNGCIDTLAVHLKVDTAIVVSVLDSAVLYPGQSIKMNLKSNAIYYSWSPIVGLSNPGIANPVATPSESTLYYVTGATDAGCTAMDSIYVLVKDESIIAMANAFAPGSDFNSVYKVLHLGTASLKSFQIFDRWGVKVFETSDINQGWDGTYHNTPQPMGVYVYRVEAATAKGTLKIKQGNVALLR
ncbi:MAG: gliding motility-associated C-terminal domain-containing protein, partial [Chitinophagaceae bacterium]